MPAVRVVFLWHMHQPFYKDLVSGEYRLPWVRLHALKDYYGMVKLLDEFPNVHQTFNLVPSLIAQLEDYVAGARDPFLTMVSKPAHDLTPDDRRLALTYLLQANAGNMIARYPRYRELWERERSCANAPDRGVRLFSDQDFTDLQVLSQIAWLDEFFLEDPGVAAIIRKGRGFNEDEKQFVIAKEKEIIAAVLPAYRDAAARNVIEISTSPYYHPILPLVCDTDTGRASAPGLPLPVHRFQHPEDAREQLKRGLDMHERVFGRRPRGVWPSEGTVSEEAVAIASELGVEWMATDEGVLARSIGTEFRRDTAGILTGDGSDRLYRAYHYANGDARVNFLFRDHALSDLIGFVYSGVDPKAAAADFIVKIKRSSEIILKKGRDAIVPIILDGENAWEYYPASGREFLRRLYDGIQNDPAVEAVTVSEAMARHRHFGELKALVPGSWINANFNVWIGAPEDNRSWDALSATRDFYSQAGKKATAERRNLAFEEILIAEGSDWNWWYGPEHHSANDRDFDELYRKHLSNVYLALGATPPDYLAQPIAAPEVRPSFIPQTGFIHPRIMSETARYFDWIGAAMYTADRRSGSMHGKQFLLDSVYAGVDEENLYGRLDFTGELPVGDFDVVALVDSLGPDGDPTVVSKRMELRLETTVHSGAITNWTLREVQPATQPEMARRLQHRDREIAGSGERRHRGVEVNLRKNFAFKIPLATLKAGMGSLLKIRFSLWRDRLPVDALPLEGWIELRVTSEDQLESSIYNYSVSS